MSTEQNEQSKGGISKVKLAIGAASLFLFIVGIKRTFKADESPTSVRFGDEAPPEDSPAGHEPDGGAEVR